MVLDQPNFCGKCYKSECFRLIFHLLMNYQNQNLQIYYDVKIKTRTIFNANFYKFMILHFYIVSTAIRFSALTYVLHNDSK